MVHSRDDNGVRVAHEVNLPKTSHNNLLDQPKMLSKSCYRYTTGQIDGRNTSASPGISTPLNNRDESNHGSMVV